MFIHIISREDITYYSTPEGGSKKRTGFNINETSLRFVPSPVLISQSSGRVHKILTAPCLKVSWLRRLCSPVGECCT